MGREKMKHLGCILFPRQRRKEERLLSLQPSSSQLDTQWTDWCLPTQIRFVFLSSIHICVANLIIIYLSIYLFVQVADTSKEPNLLKHRDVKNSILESAGKTPELGIVPTFSEFIDYVLKETRGLQSPRDWKGVMTWKSYYSKCLPCDVKFDVIMKLETHTEDEKWIINTRYRLNQ